MIKWFNSLEEKTQERLLMVVLAVLSLVLLIAVAYRTFPPQLDTSKMDKYAYYVQSGDTLWGLASEYCPDGVDYRVWIAAVRDLNDMDGGYIYEGQKIYLWTE
jgi:hypothetical protein